MIKELLNKSLSHIQPQYNSFASAFAAQLIKIDKLCLILDMKLFGSAVCLLGALNLVTQNYII